MARGLSGSKPLASQIAESLTRLDLMIRDENGYLSCSASGRALPFNLPGRLYVPTSGTFATNLSSNKWATVFADVESTKALLKCHPTHATS
jgi:hypothetical protein